MRNPIVKANWPADLAGQFGVGQFPSSLEVCLKAVVFKQTVSSLQDVHLFLGIAYQSIQLTPVINVPMALSTIQKETVDLVIVDTAVSNGETPSLIKQIREISNAALIVLTEKADDIEKALLLESGSDDCIDKPVKAVEFIPRVKALIRRTRHSDRQEPRMLSAGKNLVINLGTHQVLFCGEQVKFTPHEFRLLAELSKNIGAVVESRQLLETVWGAEYVKDIDFLKKYIFRIRCKIEANPHNPKFLLNERGIGYKLLPLLAMPVLLFGGTFSFLQLTVLS